MATNVPVCDIAEELRERLKKFKFRKEKNNAAIVLKIDKDSQMVVLDEQIEDLDLDSLKDELPAHQPRYVLVSYEYKHSDGRISYPFIFIFVSPQGCHPELTMMYAGTKQAVVKFADVTKVFEIRDVEELSEEFVCTKLAFFK